MKINGDFIVRQIGEDYILVPAGSTALTFSGMASTNEVGILVYNDIKEGRSVNDIIHHIMDEYDVDHPTANNDVDKFIDLLVNSNIIIK